MKTAKLLTNLEQIYPISDENRQIIDQFGANLTNWTNLSTNLSDFNTSQAN